jgi:hypothetical protein
MTLILNSVEDLKEAIVNYEEDHADEILKIEDRKAKRKEREQYDEELDADVQTGTCLKVSELALSSLTRKPISI